MQTWFLIGPFAYAWASSDLWKTLHVVVYWKELLCWQVRGALETLINALSAAPGFHDEKTEVQPALINSDLFSREPGSVPLVLSLLVLLQAEL